MLNVSPIGFKSVIIQYVSAEKGNGKGETKTYTCEDAVIQKKISNGKGTNEINIFPLDPAPSFKKIYAEKNPIVTKITNGSSLSVEGCDVHIKNIEEKDSKIRIVGDSKVTVDNAKNAGFKVNAGTYLHVAKPIDCTFKVDRNKVNIIWIIGKNTNTDDSKH